MADSTQFQIDIDVPSGGTSAAADAVARLATQLEAAGASATAAAEAVRAGEAAYSAAEKAAARTALAVEKIGLAADQQRGKLAAAIQVGDVSGAERAAAALQRLTQRQAEAVTKAEAAKVAVASEAVALDKLRASSSAAEAAEANLSKAHKQATDIAKASEKASTQAAAGVGKVNEIAEGLGKLGGPAGAAGQKIFGLAEGFKKLGSSLGAAGPYVAVAVAIIAISTAAIAATVALTLYSIKLSDAADSQSRLYAGMVQSVSGGLELESAIDRIATRVPQTNEKLRSMASELAKTGLRGKELEDALDSAAQKAAEAEFGPEWAKQVNTLDKQSELFKSHLTGLFRLNTGPLAAGLSRLVGLFDETSATGKAIKVVFDSLMQPLIDGLTELVPVIVKAFIQFEIWALRALIAIKPYGSKIQEVAEGLGVVAAIVGGLLLAAFAILATASLAFIAALSFAVQTFVSMVSLVYDTVSGAVEWLTGLSLADIGQNLIAGLAEGILGGGSAVLDAITGTVSGAIDSAKKLLGIASPSKVFAEIGAHTAEGMAQGVDSGAGDVQGSLQSLVSPPSSGGSPLAPAAPSVSKSGHNFSGANFVFQGVKDGQDAYDKFLSFLEGDVDQLGAGEAQPA